jgi:hypothetical protein
MSWYRGMSPLLRSRQVDPELDAVEEPAVDDELLRRQFAVQDP